MREPNYFMVRSIDKSEEALGNFTDNGIVAVGWSDVNFLEYKDPEEIFANLPYMASIAPQTAGRHKGQIVRFLSIKKNDRIIVPFWDTVCLAKATGSRRYNEHNHDTDQANETSVEYLRTESNELLLIPRDSLSEGLQRRLRVRGMTISNLNEFAEEIEGYFKKGSLEKVAYSWKEGFEEIQQEKIIAFKSRLLENIRSGYTNLKTGGIGLEQLILELVTIEGYKAYIPSKQTFPSLADADVVAVKADKFSESKLLFQIKHHSGVSGTWGIEQLLEIKKRLPDEFLSHKLVFVTSANVSQEVEKLSENNDVTVIDGNELVNWISELIKQISGNVKVKLGIIEIPQVL